MRDASTEPLLVLVLVRLDFHFRVSDELLGQTGQRLLNIFQRYRYRIVRIRQVKIEGELLEKVKQCSDAAGYESVDEFVIHMLEKEIKKIMPPEESNTSKEEVQKRLRGLGYIE